MLADATAADSSSEQHVQRGKPAKSGLTRRMHAMKRMSLHIKFYSDSAHTHIHTQYTQLCMYGHIFYISILRELVRKKASVSRKYFWGIYMYATAQLLVYLFMP